MRKLLIFLVFIAVSCKGPNKENSPTENSRLKSKITSEFQLIKVDNQKGLLILFPCFPCDGKNTLTEFEISDITTKNGFSVLAMNFNKRLFLSTEEKQELTNKLEAIISQNNLSKENIFIGGFSSGGNVSLLISNYLIQNNSKIQPKGVFVVDSPIDLLALYKTAEKNIKLNFSEPSIQEATWIKSFFDNEFGNPEKGITNYEKNSPYTFQTQNIENLKELEDLKIRFYSEPDLKWWQENRKNNYQDLNAYYIKELSKKLKEEFGNKNIEFIETKNKGYRSNGERHPHSWAIVDEEELIIWMKE